VSFGPAFNATTDLAREMPAAPEARLDRVTSALASLRSEQRRLERLGLELPMARCREQIRYWEFLGALFAIETGETR
jgi:hypothetical protein